MLDRSSLELRRIEFAYVNLPGWIPKERAGGEVRLRRFHSGAWAPYAWRVRGTRAAPRGRACAAQAGRLGGVRRLGAIGTGAGGAGGQRDDSGACWADESCRFRCLPIGLHAREPVL